MNTSTIDTPITTVTYTIVQTGVGNYVVLANGIELRDTYGNVRYFVTRNSARKRISRERFGDFHN